MNDARITVGIIGAGANTQRRHIPGLRAIDGVEIVGVVNRRPESTRQVQDDFEIPRGYAHWTEAIEDPDTNAIVIGTWPSLHAPAAIAALEAGKHVLCEARMAMNAREARQMLVAAQSKPGLVAQVVPFGKTFPVDRTIKRLIREGYLGEILAVEVRAYDGFIDHNAPFAWHHDPDRSGLNVLSVGMWYEAVLRWVGEATRVIALGRTFVKTRKDARGLVRAMSKPDHLNVVASMACGAQLHLFISSVCGPAGEPEVMLWGSEATLCLVGSQFLVCHRGQTEFSEIEIPEGEAGQWRVEEEFVDAIRGCGEISHTSFEDGVKYMEFTEAVWRSLTGGCAISLPLWNRFALWTHCVSGVSSRFLCRRGCVTAGRPGSGLGCQ